MSRLCELKLQSCTFVRFELIRRDLAHEHVYKTCWVCSWLQIDCNDNKIEYKNTVQNIWLNIEQGHGGWANAHEAMATSETRLLFSHWLHCNLGVFLDCSHWNSLKQISQQSRTQDFIQFFHEWRKPWKRFRPCSIHEPEATVTRKFSSPFGWQHARANQETGFSGYGSFWFVNRTRPYSFPWVTYTPWSTLLCKLCCFSGMQGLEFHLTYPHTS